jgi:hypothetical protein
MLALDTDLEAQRVQLVVLSRLGNARCAELSLEMSDESRELSRSGIRRRHPAYSPTDVEWALRRMLYGDDLFGRAWPDAPRIDP